MTAAPTLAPASTTPLGRLGALARAELTLLGRARGTLFMAMIVPLALPFSVQNAVDEKQLKEAGLDMAALLIPSSIGFTLLFAVLSALLTTFVGRREELVLKRLRTGEARDHEILLGTAAPVVLIGLGQILLVCLGSTLAFGVSAPEAAGWTVLGTLLGLGLAVLSAALMSSFARTVENASVISLPLIMFSLLGSGVSVPLEVLPDRLAQYLQYLPFSPAMTLVRGGWSGDLSAAEAGRAALLGLGWLVVALWGMRRWFRWEPRR